MESALLLVTGLVSLVYLVMNINWMVFGGAFDFVLLVGLLGCVVLIDFSFRKTEKATTRPAVVLITSGLVLVISLFQLLMSSHPIGYFFTTDFQLLRVLSMGLLVVTMTAGLYQLATAPG